MEEERCLLINLIKEKFPQDGGNYDQHERNTLRELMKDLRVGRVVLERR